MRDILKLIPKDYYIDGVIITKSISVDPKKYYYVQITHVQFFQMFDPKVGKLFETKRTPSLI